METGSFLSKVTKNLSRTKKDGDMVKKVDSREMKVEEEFFTKGRKVLIEYEVEEILLLDLFDCIL